MKVFIGPYKNYIGIYQIVDKLRYIGVSEKNRDSIIEYMRDTWLDRLCETIYKRNKRNIKIKLHKYDTWAMDDTLSLIILPMLKQLHVTSHSMPHIDDADVPVELRACNAPSVDDGDLDSHFEDRGNWLFNELIWTFEQLQHDYPWEDQYFANSKVIDLAGLKSHQDRIANGLRLFGVYYQTLWD